MFFWLPRFHTDNPYADLHEAQMDLLDTSLGIGSRRNSIIRSGSLRSTPKAGTRPHTDLLWGQSASNFPMLSKAMEQDSIEQQIREIQKETAALKQLYDEVCAHARAHTPWGRRGWSDSGGSTPDQLRPTHSGLHWTRPPLERQPVGDSLRNTREPDWDFKRQVPSVIRRAHNTSTTKGRGGMQQVLS